MATPYASAINRVYQFLNTLGIPSDDPAQIDFTGDYSATPNDIYIQAQPGEVLQLHRIMVSVGDSGSFDSGSYGNGLALVNGIQGILAVVPPGGGTLLEVSALEAPIKTNTDWAGYVFDTRVDSYGSGNEQLSARWSFDKAGQPIYLDGDKGGGEKLIVRLNDNFTGLTKHRFHVQGIRHIKAAQ